jgi:hypothetical protein
MNNEAPLYPLFFSISLLILPPISYPHISYFLYFLHATPIDTPDDASAFLPELFQL